MHPLVACCRLAKMAQRQALATKSLIIKLLFFLILNAGIVSRIGSRIGTKAVPHYHDALF